MIYKLSFCFLILLNLISFYNFSFGNESIPNISSKNIVIIDRKTNSILYEKNAFNKVPMASTTKIMTAIIALENSSLNDKVYISEKASKVSGSTIGLKKDTVMTMNDLLYGLMLRSGNDCAIAIAEYIAGSVDNFSILMNNKANLLGLYSTHFESPHGLDSNYHFTSAYDLAILSNYALHNDTFKKIVSTKYYNILLNSSSYKIHNTNDLLGNFDGIYGVKTGFTFNAGRCLVSACNRNNLDIICVVLGSDTTKIRTKDSKEIINYIYNNYYEIDLTNFINNSFNNFKNNICRFKLYKSIDIPDISYLSTKQTTYIIKKDSKITSKLIYNPYISYNTPISSAIGELLIFNDNTLLFKTPIYINNTLKKINIYFYFKTILKFIFNLV